MIRKREIWEGRYHEASGFSCLVDVGLQEWQAWQGSGRVFEDGGDYHHCGYCYCCHTPVARGGIGEIVSLSQAQGCTRNAMTTSVAAVIRYQEWLTVAQQSGVCEKEGEVKCGGMKVTRRACHRGSRSDAIAKDGSIENCRSRRCAAPVAIRHT
jgi:hypothetical protein